MYSCINNEQILQKGKPIKHCYLGEKGKKARTGMCRGGHVVGSKRIGTFSPRSCVTNQQCIINSWTEEWISNAWFPRFGPSLIKYVLMHSISLREILPSSLTLSKSERKEEFSKISSNHYTKRKNWRSKLFYILNNKEVNKLCMNLMYRSFTITTRNENGWVQGPALGPALLKNLN